MDEEKKCKNCKLRIKGIWCDSEKFKERMGEGSVANDGISFGQSMDAGFMVGDDFGCVHFESNV